MALLIKFFFSFVSKSVNNKIFLMTETETFDLNVVGNH